MSGFACASMVMQYFGGRLAEAEIKSTDFSGPYLWQGEEFDMRISEYNTGGFVEEYSNKETFCTSYVYHTGLSLMGDGVLIFLYLLFMCWLFVGIAILSDIFMDAIEIITSKSTIVQIPDTDGNLIEVEKMLWNPTIANLTLMALGSSAPEIILSVADTLGRLGGIPSELGPQTIVGSAAFNLLIISAVSIMAVTEPKGIKMLGVFIATAIFSTWAYVWFFLVLVIISPGYVEMWEAWVTLGFMVILVVVAYACDRSHQNKESEEEKKASDHLQAVKTALRVLNKKFGMKAMIDVGQGHTAELQQGIVLGEGDVTNIKNYFRVILDKDPMEATVDELIDCLAQDNLVERIAYRKAVGSAGKRDFVRLNKGEKGQAQFDKKGVANESQTVAFKHLKYEVSESNGDVAITIEKKTNKAFSFWVQTVDRTAIGGEDYHTFSELISMKAEDKDCIVKVGIVDDPEWEPDEDFEVHLQDAETRKLLPGDDTKCNVLILDEDKAGTIGFEATTIDVRRKDQVAYINLIRKDGSDGTISCTVNTISDVNTVPGKQAAKEGIDYVPLRMQQVTFKAGEVEQRLEIEMPDCVGEETKENLEEGEELDTVSFSIQLTNPKPDGVKLSKKSTCYINIEEVDESAEQAAEYERKKMLDFFLAEKEVTWGQQFKNACVLGPAIDEDDMLVEDVSCSDAVWHFLSMFWKVIGAIVPPGRMCGGWAAFCASLAIIGIVTTIVGEVATVLGCVSGLKPSVAGITLVALGTSLPDTLASKTAAIQSDSADSAIGNVTGSNSVNVFLGMGLPWIIGCIYWQIEAESDYAVPPGTLSFSIIVFLCTSMVCFAVLGLRRVYVGGELGGHGWTRPLSAALLVFLWCIFITLVSLESYGFITVNIGDIPPVPEFD